MPGLVNVKLKVLPFPESFALNVPSGSCEDRSPVVLSTPSKRPEVTVCVMGSSLRQVIVVPIFTVVVEGWNISELRLMTGPAGADAVGVGAVAGVSESALQPARPAAAMNKDAAQTTSRRRTGWLLAISTTAIRHDGIGGWVRIQNRFFRSTNVRRSDDGTNPKHLGVRSRIQRDFPAAYNAKLSWRQGVNARWRAPAVFDLERPR